MEQVEVFQVDSTVVKAARRELANYSVEIDHNSPNTHLCVVWFSSNAIYFPNDEPTFRRSILNRDYYEWRTAAPLSAHKHIFVRDLYKQWYLKGISDAVSTPPHLLKFLKDQTKGYEIITVGSSAGGYAACLYGQMLGASRVYAFNAQFELNSLLRTSTEAINPLLFRLKDDSESRKLYDIKPIVKDVPVYYFASARSTWDAAQMAHIAGCNNITTIKFRTAHHGVPFPKAALGTVLSCDPTRLAALSDHEFTPWGFSRRFIGTWRTLCGAAQQTLRYLKRRMGR